MSSPKSVPVNVSKVRDPAWNREDGMALVVSRGEPRRSNLQVQQAAADQARRYLDGYTDLQVSDIALALTVQLIAADHIDPPGKQMLALPREHFLLYVAAAQRKLGELAKHDG